MKVQIILASTRPGRVTERVAKWVTKAASELPEFEAELLDLADYDLPHFNEAVSPRYNPSREPVPVVRRWLEKADAADAFVIVTPEYNHSIPGILKDAIDYLSFQFAKKPVAIVSHGAVGGARAAEQLKQILIEAKAAVVPEAVALMGAQGVIDEHGNFTGDTTSPYGPDAAVRSVLGELNWWARTLKAGREQVAAVR